ncbi:hypothetical protein QVD17_17098 [Tagetes erecta]|uniref:Uncharacterized protein n=1 Tax=Tagetes erecta TaxID=13708 RepID=A0AAD8P026_TARER|nr:hypothetical protein QVD17_17098 [Tagetes erecta]
MDQDTSSQDLVQGNMISTQTLKETDSRDQGDGNADREKTTKRWSTSFSMLQLCHGLGKNLNHNSQRRLPMCPGDRARLLCLAAIKVPRTKIMQEKGTQDDGLGPFGICHRLFNFLMNTILTRGTRRVIVETSVTTSPQDDETQAFEASHMDQGEMIRAESHELPVEFRHTERPMVNQTSDSSGEVLVQENRISTQPRKETQLQDQSKGNDGREKGRKRSTLTIVEGGSLPGRKHHLLSVDSNINEKADAFIRSKKEAMEKALNMKHTNDV